MLFKSLRLASRSGRAHALFMKGDLIKAHDLFISILKDEPDDRLAPMVYGNLAEIEHMLGNAGSSKYYAELYMEIVEKYPAMKASPNLQKHHAKMQSYLGVGA